MSPSLMGTNNTAHHHQSTTTSSSSSSSSATTNWTHHCSYWSLFVYLRYLRYCSESTQLMAVGLILCLSGNIAPAQSHATVQPCIRPCYPYILASSCTLLQTQHSMFLYFLYFYPPMIASCLHVGLLNTLTCKL